MIVLLPFYDTCFCFSCQQFCSLFHCSRSRVPRLRRISTICSLPAAEKKEGVIIAPCGTMGTIRCPNDSRFPAIDEEDFLAGIRVMPALNKVGSQYLRTEFCRDARRFHGEFLNCVLSPVASTSVIGHGLSCFCPAIVVGGDDVAPFQLFNKLLDGLLEKDWTKGSEFQASRVE